MVASFPGKVGDRNGMGLQLHCQMSRLAGDFRCCVTLPSTSLSVKQVNNPRLIGRLSIGSNDSSCDFHRSQIPGTSPAIRFIQHIKTSISQSTYQQAPRIRDRGTNGLSRSPLKTSTTWAHSVVSAEKYICDRFSFFRRYRVPSE